MRYRLIAIDLDGTLLDDWGRISPANAAAIRAAQRQGAMVVPCTGRAWRESQTALPAFMQNGKNLGIFVTGAAVSDLATGRTLDIAVLEPQLAQQVVRMLHDLPEAVLVFRDANLTGHDYLVTGRGVLSPNTQWWFQFTEAYVHFQRRVALDDLHHAMRIGIVAGPQRVVEVARMIERTMGDQVMAHSFEALRGTERQPGVHVLEVFARDVSKWRGLEWVARQRGIDASQVVMIGDGHNDLAALRSAGCSIAVANAVPAVRDLADHVTLSCASDGVAHAIEQLLAGHWG